MTLEVPVTPPLAIVPVRRGDVRLTVQIQGQVVSTRTDALYFHNGGTVASVAVTDGQRVAAGTVLASLDTGGLAFQIASDRLQVERDRLALESLQIAAPPASSPQQAEQQAMQLRQAQLTLAQDEVTVADQELSLRESEVVAPFAGEVNDVSVAPGDQVSPFETVMVLSDPASEVLAASGVAPDVAQELHRGQAAVFVLNGRAALPLAGSVASVTIPTLAQVAQAAANGQPVPTPSVVFRVPRLPPGTPLGETFTATVTLAEQRDALYVPSDAIRQFNGFDYVDILRDGRAAEVPVRLGLQGDTTTAIDRGVSAGEQVIEP